jgi:hypothetical protein
MKDVTGISARLFKHVQLSASQYIPIAKEYSNETNGT